jgi:glycosyltransferase involved in cell wall biosynthesis
MSRHDVCASVVSDLPFDARVWKEARSLARDGRSVALLGCAYGRDDLRRRNEDGVDVLEVPFGWRDRPKSVVRRARTLLRLWWEILRTSARAYHAHNVHVAIPAWISARARRARLVYDAHELYGEPDDPSLRSKLLARGSALLEAFMVKRSDAVISTNPSRADVLRERHGREDVTVVQNVPQLQEEVIPIDPGYPDGRDVLLYQGWITAESRAFRETVLALRELEGVDFVILGFGHDSSRDQIRQWAQEAGLADRVHFLPARPFDELVQTAAAATVGLVPIRGDWGINQYLGDTNKMHEYLMAGLPCVASDLPEIRRVIESGEPPVGELFDPNSPESIAAAVRAVLDDRELYEARRREAQRLSRERFNWTVEERGLLDVYDRLLGPVAGRATPALVSS